MGLATIILPAVYMGLISSRQGRVQQSQRNQASTLMQETVEAVRVVRENGWTAFAVNGTYHPAVSAGTWTLVSGTETVGQFIRAVDIADVHRDSSGTIVSSGGNNDPSTKQITITVSWAEPLPSSVSSTSFLTRYLDNLQFIETTEAEFNLGVQTGTTVTNTSGGEVVLGAGGFGNWCEPALTISPLDLPKNGVANAISAIEGRVFAGTGDNASGVSFAEVSVTNSNPPIPSIIKTFDGYKTNDVFGETNYAYLATDTNFAEIAIVDLSVQPAVLAGFFDADGIANASSVYVSGSVGYMTQGNILRNFDLSSKSGSRPPLDTDGVTLAGTGTKVAINGNYAFVSLSGSSTEMQIIDISNTSNLVVVGQADVDGQAGSDIYIDSSGTRAYLATGVSSSQRELFIIDTESKSGNRPVIGSYEANGLNPKGIVLTSGNKAILVGLGGEEYQVINVSNESTPVRCGGLNIDAGINGIDTVLEEDGDAFSYIITGDSGTELNIIEGGPGGSYSATGIFDSAIFDTGYQTAFNRFYSTITTPPQTTLRFQMAVADQVSGSCASANFIFVGPDGTSSTFFTSNEGSVPLSDDGSGYENPAHCFRYRIYLDTTDSNYTPIFSDISVNYSP